MRILVVSDDRGVSRILERTLGTYDHDVEIVDDGSAAWEALQARPADLVLSDWALPGCSGLELCQRLRATQEQTYTYFILVTAADRQHNLETAMQAGVDDYLGKPINLHELRARLHVATRISALHDELADRRAALETANKRLFEAGRRDPLTNLWNRRQLTDDLAQLRQLSTRYRRPVCLAICDVDRFKLYNDRYGHVEGDRVLVRVAQLLGGESRAMDQVYRFGGEEFILTLPEVTLDQAVVVMERLRLHVQALGMPHPDAGPEDVLTMSVGVAELEPRVDATAEAWVARADKALYAAKHAGRNQVALAPGESAAPDPGNPDGSEATDE